MSKSIDEIAVAIGVSVTTVKLVISGKAKQYRISQKTQSAIEAYIEEHGYRINQAARSLKIKKSETLGLVIPNLTNSYFAQIAECLGQIAQNYGYQLITVSTNDDEALEKKQTDILLGRGVDGLFVASSSANRQKHLPLEAKHIPIVFLDRDFGVTELSRVISDNYQGSFDMTAQMLEKTTSDIFYLYGDGSLPTIQNRLRGFLDAHELKDRRLHPSWNFSVPHNTDVDGYYAMESAYKQLKRIPEALVFSSLPILEGALHFIRQRYGTIPSQMLIATYDDHNMLEFLPNTVLAVNQNIPQLTKYAAQSMEYLLNSESLEVPDKYKVINPSLIVRDRKWQRDFQLQTR